MELDVLARLQLQPTMECVVWAWPLTLKLEVSNTFAQRTALRWAFSGMYACRNLKQLKGIDNSLLLIRFWTQI